MSNNRQNKGNKIRAKDLRKKIDHYFRKNPGKSYSARQLIDILRIPNSKDSVEDALKKLQDKNKVEYAGDGRYQAGLKTLVKSEKTEAVYTGLVDRTRSGDAFIICKGLDDDIFVPQRYLKGALDLDKVEVEVTRVKKNRKPEGRILRILERSREEILANLYNVANKGFARPLDKDIDTEIEIDLDKLGEAKEGDLVIAQITQWPERPNQPLRARVGKVVSQYNQHELESLQILLSHGFNAVFPGKVEAEMEKVSEKITSEDEHGRRDFRDIPTFTIDPADAKDFDDALSFRVLQDGNREVSIHIADVSHYLKPGSATDKEALKRSTSVYMVGKVAPMLPEKLSNNICSLRPDEDRLTFSAVFVFDKDNKIINRWFGKGIIHSDRRFSYEEAQESMKGGKGDFANELRELNKLANVLRERRFKTGSINFQTREIRFELDESGFPVDIIAKETLETNQLIEDFMLLANREVAQYIQQKEKSTTVPFVYRIHDEPDRDKLADFALLAKELGFPFDLQSPAHISRSFNRLMQEARQHDELKLLEPLAIRTMSKAEYSTENIGHYGLGFEYYTHFTSPIRRYSDVIVHRILFAELQGRRPSKLFEDLQDKTRYISERERAAMQAERESIKLKQAQYMEQFKGKEFKGTITGFIDKGLFVELDKTYSEGLATFDQFDEPFVVADNSFTAMGKYSGSVLQMGGKVLVRVADVNVERRQIDLEFVSTLDHDY